MLDAQVRLLKLDKSSFITLLGSLHAELVRRVPHASARLGLASFATTPQAAPPAAAPAAPAASSWMMGLGGQPSSEASSAPGSASDAARPMLSLVGASSTARAPLVAPPSTFVRLKTLGRGGYGSVSLVKDGATRRMFALKSLRKAHILSSNGATRCEWLLREKLILQELNHPMIVPLFGTFADASTVYLLLGVAMGGDLFRLCARLGPMRDQRYDLLELISRFYTASLTLALEHIHAHDIVYRDLKPENCLIDAHGYLKLADFGFAKKVTDRTYTRCGTTDYTAPEMLLNQGVNQAADWWALGIVLFEFLVGLPPFTAPDGDEMQTYKNIIKGDVDGAYPPGPTPAPTPRSLVKGLLTVSVARRLGYLKAGAEDIIEHGWLRSLDWHGLVNQTITPPWQPDLCAADDTQHFDDFDDLDDSADTPSTPAKAPLDECWAQLCSAYSEGSVADSTKLGW